MTSMLRSGLTESSWMPVIQSESQLSCGFDAIPCVSQRTPAAARQPVEDVSGTHRQGMLLGAGRSCDGMPSASLHIPFSISETIIWL